MKALLARGMLALLLLFAQQQAAVHWLTHAGDAKHAKAAGSSPAEHCDECLSLSALGAAATPSAPALPEPLAHDALASAPVARSAPALLLLAFRSRAPPVLS